VSVRLYEQSYADRIVATSGLVAYWRLGDRGGTVARDAGGRSHGTYNAGPALGAAGAIVNDLGRSVTFATASAQYVSSPVMNDLPLGAAKRTLECWVNSPTLPDNRQGYFGYGDPGANQVVNLEYLPGQGLYIVGYAAGDLAPSPPNVLINGQWHHIAVTYDGVTARSYLDGKQAGIGARSWNTTSAGKVLGIGRQSYNDPPYYYVGGRIAEAAIYRRVLSALELAEHNAAGRGAL
jgi:hypothetical protein